MGAVLTAWTREACAGCGSPGLVTVLDLGQSPLADRFTATPDADEAWYRLRMAVCQACWLAQLLDVVDDAELYGADYGFLTGGSPAAAAGFADLAARLLGEYGEQAKRLTVEIACNDGTLLRHFAGAGCRTLGVEPSAAATAAQAAGLDVLAVPFTEETGYAIRDTHGPAGLVVACNVAAHVADPLAFLRGVRALLADDGAAVFEFQDLAALVAGCQFDHVYHEHRFFYSAGSFASLAGRAGLTVTGVEPVGAQGGSLRVTAAPRRPDAAEVRAGWLGQIGAYAPLQPRAEAIRDQLLGLLYARGGTVAGYAASAKSATLLNFCGIGPRTIPWIVDATPSKHGRYAPGSRIPIVPGGERPDPWAYLLLAWNYLGPVLRREHEYIARGGRLIVPIPEPVII